MAERHIVKPIIINNMTKVQNVIKKIIAFLFIVEEPVRAVPYFKFYRAYLKIKFQIDRAYHITHMISINNMLVEFDKQYRGHQFFGEYFGKLVSAKETQKILIELNLITPPPCEA